jgi:CRP-like cAMP-binding protein
MSRGPIDFQAEELAMGAAHPIVGKPHLNHVSPLNRLDSILLDELLAYSRMERLPPGRCLFKQKDADARTLFLLSGQLALVSEDHQTRIVRADAREARAPIDPHDPHRVTALARTSVTILSVDTALLADLLARCAAGAAGDGNSAHPATIIEPMLALPLFAHLPPAHLHVLKQRMAHVHAAAGTMLFKAGDPARFYYLIKSGRIGMSRPAGHHGQETLPMELGPGEGLGETSLIDHGRHEFTATALEDSQVLRISKGEFLTLLVRPHNRWLTYSEVVSRQQAGAVLLDVRSPRAYHRSHLPDSLNLPLKMLRQMARILDTRHEYVLYTDRPRHGMTAAFLLACRGIAAGILRDVPVARKQAPRPASHPVPGHA